MHVYALSLSLPQTNAKHPLTNRNAAKEEKKKYSTPPIH